MINREEIANALTILAQAMQLEQEGREFYLKAAKTTKEEKGHFDILMMRYDFLFGPIAWSS